MVRSFVAAQRQGWRPLPEHALPEHTSGEQHTGDRQSRLLPPTQTRSMAQLQNVGAERDHQQEEPRDPQETATDEEAQDVCGRLVELVQRELT